MPFGRPMRGRKDNIDIDIKEVICQNMDFCLVEGYFEDVLEHSGSMKGVQFFHNLSDYQLLKKGPIP